MLRPIKKLTSDGRWITYYISDTIKAPSGRYEYGYVRSGNDVLPIVYDQDAEAHIFERRMRSVVKGPGSAHRGVRAWLFSITSRYDEVRKGSNGRLLLVKRNGKQSVAVVELHKSRNSYRVVTAYHSRSGYIEKKQLLQGGAPFPPDGDTRKSMSDFPCVNFSQKQPPTNSVAPNLISRKRRLQTMILVKARRPARLVEKKVWVKHPKTGKPFQKTVWVLPGEEKSGRPTAVQEDLFSAEELASERKEALSVPEPETNDDAISDLIASVTPENRAEIQAKIFGNDPGEAKEEPPFHYEPEDVNIPFFPHPVPAGSEIVYAKNFSDVPPIHVKVFNKKTILNQERPSWIPDIPIEIFKTKHWWVPIKDNGDGTYDIKWQYRKGAYKADFGVARINLEVLVATLDYYSKRAAAEEKEDYDAREKDLKVEYTKKLAKFDAEHSKEEIARDPRLRGRRRFYENLVRKKKSRPRHLMVPDRKMSYEQMAVYESGNTRSNWGSRQEAWGRYKDLRSIIKQKASDMEMQRIEWESSFGKGRETAYGNSNTNDALLEPYGVMVKRQNGDEITEGEIDQIRSAIDKVFSVYGDRSSMARSYGLKISHSGDKLMHACKFGGVFFPAYHAIGVTAKHGDDQFGFTLAHEWAHFMDSYLGGKARFFASDNYNSTAGTIARTFRKNMMESQKSEYQNRTCECFARAFEQYFATKTGMAADYHKDNNETGNHPEQHVFEEKVVPLIERFLRENDGLLKSIVERREGRKLTKRSTVFFQRIIKSQSGLVPRQVTYLRDGKSVTGTVWVRSDDNDFLVASRKFMQGTPVASLSGEEFCNDGTPLIGRISQYFEDIGGMVTNPILGEILLNRRSIKDSLSHGLSRMRVAAFAAIPKVLKHGIVVDYQKNWKGRGYDTHVIAAPIEINGDRYHVGAVLVSHPTQKRFYTHEIIVEKESRDAPFKTGALEYKNYPGGQHPGSIKMILQRISGVNDIRKSRTVYMQKSLTWSGHKLQGRTTFQGFNISIENRAGTYRRGTDPDGHEWKTKLHNDYGYIRGSVGVDGDHVDCFLGPDRDSRKVYIIHQVKPGSQAYDEDKVMLGFSGALQVKKAYLSNYDRSDMFGAMESVTIDQLKSLIDRRKGRKLTKAIPVMVMRKSQRLNPRLIPKQVTFIRDCKQVIRTQMVLPENYMSPDEKLRVMHGPALVELSGDEFPPDGTLLSAKILKFFDSFGNQVKHPVLGKIILDKDSVKSSIGHSPRRLKSIAYSALPFVFKKGVIIDYQRDWKRRGYDTYLVAGPVTIAGERYFVGAVVRHMQRGKRYYTHDVLIEKENQEGHKSGRNRSYGADSYPPGSIRRLLSKYTVVNDVQKSLIDRRKGRKQTKAILTKKARTASKTDLENQLANPKLIKRILHEILSVKGELR